jgi:hypothetical protein
MALGDSEEEEGLDQDYEALDDHHHLGGEKKDVWLEPLFEDVREAYPDVTLIQVVPGVFEVVDALVDRLETVPDEWMDKKNQHHPVKSHPVVIISEEIYLIDIKDKQKEV